MTVLLAAPRREVLPADLSAALERYTATFGCPKYLHDAVGEGGVVLADALARIIATSYEPKYLRDAAVPWLAGR